MCESDATRRADVAASLALAADAVPPGAAARAEAEEAARSAASGEAFGVSGDADADTLARRVLASRCRAAFLYDARECLDDDGDARSGGDAGETLAFLGETHVSFKRASETYVSTLGFAETPACFREPSARETSGEEASAEAEEAIESDAAAKESRAARAGSVLAQWRSPIAPPVSFRADRRTKNASPVTLALIVATTKTPETPETPETSETSETETTSVGPSTTLVGEICLDAAAVRRAQRAVRDARAAALAAEPKRSAGDPADDLVVDTDADAASANAANAKATAKATEMAKRATAAVASLFATKASAGVFVSSEDAPSLVDAGAEPNPLSAISERPPVVAFPTTSSFLETLEAFVSPELGVVAEDDAAFAAFVEAAVSGRARTFSRASRTGE